MKQRYIVSTRFYHNYFKNFLEEEKIQHEVSWTEEEMTNKIITADVDDNQKKKIEMFFRFPRKITKEA